MCRSRDYVSMLGHFLTGLGIAGTLVFLILRPSAQSRTEGSLATISLEGGHMHEEIGTTAGAIWKVLHTHGELTLSQLKKHTKAKTPLFEWAIGWLARENKIALIQQKRTVRVRLV